MQLDLEILKILRDIYDINNRVVLNIVEGVNNSLYWLYILREKGIS